MTTALETVEAAVLQLSADERAELIDRLLATLPPTPPLHPAWGAEIARRVAKLGAGLVKSIPAETVFAEMRQKIEAYRREA